MTGRQYLVLKETDAAIYESINLNARIVKEVHLTNLPVTLIG